MKRSVVRAVVGVCLVAGATTPVLAHHSAAMFDLEKEVSVHGTVKEFQYTNPHSWLIVVAPGADGKDVEWSFEAEGPSTMMRAGIKKSSLLPGEKVTVRTHPMKDGRPAGSWISLTKGDGTVLAPRGPVPEGPPAAGSAPAG